MCENCEQNWDGALDAVRARIASHGVAVVASKSGHLHFTVGLFERGWPELVYRGGKPDTSAEVLVGVAQFLIDQGLTPKAGVQIPVMARDLRGTMGLVLRRFVDVGVLDVARDIYGEHLTALEVIRDPFVALLVPGGYGETSPE